MSSKRRATMTTQCALVLLVSVLLVPTRADDQFVCCMRGIKTIRNIRFCPAPCCEGYLEKIVYPAKLARIAYCVKDPNYKRGERRNPLNVLDF